MSMDDLENGNFAFTRLATSPKIPLIRIDGATVSGNDCIDKKLRIYSSENVPNYLLCVAL